MTTSAGAAPDPRAFREAVAERVAADLASPDHPGAELEQITTALARRTHRGPATRLAGELRALDLAAAIDTDAPTASDRAAGRGVKVAVQRLTGWYVGHLAGQVRQLGVATARAVRASAARVDDLERRIEAIEAAPPSGDDQ